MSEWIPVSTGRYPDDGEAVQVTYLGYHDNEPYCDAVAFRRNGEWLWEPCEERAVVTITAWKKCGEPYYGI